ncbi:MAG: adenylate/guanylate cyclase domain-containing protein [Myxococcaceae bacterium]|nr:adenylate/guanylate cyclase domain-containing protein [Myxococcaceae bacterium]
MALNRPLFEQRLASLESVPNLRALAISALAALLEAPDDWRCLRINPLRVAEENGLPVDEVLDVFLHAARLGLLDLRFNLVCPGCGGVEYQMERIDAVPSGEWLCVVCDRLLQAELDDRVEVSFTPELGVRHLALDASSSLQHYLSFYFTANFERSAELKAFLASVTVALELVPPGQETLVKLEARAGQTYRLLSVDTHSQVVLAPAREGHGVTEVDAVALPEGLRPGHVSIASGPVRVRVANRRSVTVGVMAIEVDRERLIDVVTRFPSRMRPFLTAKMLLNNQTFRDLFRVQALDADLQLRLRSLTLLFTDLKGSTELYDRTGDLRAYRFVRDHFRVLTDAVKRNHGAIIKTMGDAIMASFNEPTDATRAALEMMRGMDSLSAGLKAEGHDTGLKVGLHEGSALAVTSEERLDYFGQTVNVAARVQGLAQAGEIWLTTPVMDTPGVKPLLEAGGWRGEQHEVSLKGVGGKTRVYRLQR